MLGVAEGHYGGVFVRGRAAFFYGRFSTNPEQQKQQVKLSKIPHGIWGWVILFRTPDGWPPPQPLWVEQHG